MSTERWLPCVGYPSYEVSSFGNVRRFGRHKRAYRQGEHPYGDKRNYTHVRLCENGKPTHVLVHKLVLGAFVSPRPEGLGCNHKDGDKTNNRLSNLEWVTPRANNEHATRLGLQARGERGAGSILSEASVREIYELGCHTTMLYREIADQHGVSVQLVQRIMRGRCWRHLGLKPVLRYKNASPTKSNNKLDEHKVRAMRAEYEEGDSLSVLSTRYGIRKSSIYEAVKGIVWSHVD